MPWYAQFGDLRRVSIVKLRLATITSPHISIELISHPHQTALHHFEPHLPSLNQLFFNCPSLRPLLQSLYLSLLAEGLPAPSQRLIYFHPHNANTFHLISLFISRLLTEIQIQTPLLTIQSIIENPVDDSDSQNYLAVFLLTFAFVFVYFLFFLYLLYTKLIYYLNKRLEG